MWKSGAVQQSSGQWSHISSTWPVTLYHWGRWLYSHHCIFVQCSTAIIQETFMDLEGGSEVKFMLFTHEALAWALAKHWITNGQHLRRMMSGSLWVVKRGFYLFPLSLSKYKYFYLAWAKVTYECFLKATMKKALEQSWWLLRNKKHIGHLNTITTHQE